jgi:2-polyprenyl-6-methoxyphenol hydroxylase-like FAD-dependent oxidoreductase
MACYTYWEGVPVHGGEIYARGRRAMGVWPTNDGLAMTYVAWPVGEFGAFRADPERNLLETLDLAGDRGERVRAGRRAERIRATPDLPNFFRTPAGPGWALVGDAGLVMDPITGQGIGDAFRDAELLVGAVRAGWDGPGQLEAALAGYGRQRDLQALPMYEFTAQLASFAPPSVEQQVLFEALAGNQAEIDRFLGVVTGAVPLGDYMTPGNLRKVIGVRGMAKVLLSKLRRAPVPAGAEGALDG